MAFRDFPHANLIISNLKIKHSTPVFYNESINLSGGGLDRGLHQILGSFDIHINTSHNQKIYESFLIKTRGRLNPFYLQLGGRFASEAVGVLTKTSHTVGSTEINIDSFAGTIHDGDMFTIANDDKIYLVMDELINSGLLTFFPALRKPIPIGAVLNFNPKMLVRLQDDTQSIDYGQGGIIHTTTLKFKEAL
jgi:hypothetical protein